MNPFSVLYNYFYYYFFIKYLFVTSPTLNGTCILYNNFEVNDCNLEMFVGNLTNNFNVTDTYFILKDIYNSYQIYPQNYSLSSAIHDYYLDKEYGCHCKSIIIPTSTNNWNMTLCDYDYYSSFRYYCEINSTYYLQSRIIYPTQKLTKKLIKSNLNKIKYLSCNIT